VQEALDNIRDAIREYIKAAEELARGDEAHRLTVEVDE
jgi:predicted RNase H-like HicB family nuclease